MCGDDMVGYILSVLGIIVAGVFIDIIIPSGTINKYIKSIYSIFVVAVLVSPIIKIMTKTKDFTVKYQDYEINENLLNYIYEKQVSSHETSIENILHEEGFQNVDIILNFSIDNDKLQYNSCSINLKNLVISADKQHINKYEFIKNVVKENTDLTYEEILIDEWEIKKANNKVAWKIKKYQAHWNLRCNNFHCYLIADLSVKHKIKRQNHRKYN